MIGAIEDSCSRACGFVATPRRAEASAGSDQNPSWSPADVRATAEANGTPRPFWHKLLSENQLDRVEVGRSAFVGRAHEAARKTETRVERKVRVVVPPVKVHPKLAVKMVAAYRAGVDKVAAAKVQVWG